MAKLKSACFLALCSPVVANAALESADKAWAAMSMETRCVEDTAKGEDCVTEERVRILAEPARSGFGTKTLNARKSQDLKIESAYTLQADGSRIDLTEGDIQLGDVAGDNNAFVGKRFAKVAFKDVRVGSTLVVRYRISGPQIAPFTNNSSTLWMTESRVRWDKVVIEQSSNVPLYWKTDHPDAFKATRSDDGKTLRLELVQPVYFRAVEARGDFMLRDLPRVEISTTDSWQAFLSPVASKFGELFAAALPAKAQKTVNSLSALPEEQRVAAVLDDVRQRIRYMGDWRETVRGYVPFALKEIEDRGFGDCKDMALTTAALLRAAGISANVAIVRASLDDRKPLLPTLEYLNHAIVQATVGGKSVWLDPTSPANSLSSPLEYLQNQVAFVFHDDGKVEQKVIPAQDAARDRVVEQIDYMPAGNNWTVQANIRRDGVLAANQVRIEKQGANQDEQLAREIVPGFATILDKTITRSSEASALIDSYPINVSAHASRLTRQIGSYQLFDMRYLMGTIGALRDYQAKEGVSDYYLGTFSSQRTVRIHDRKVLEPVVACHVDSPWIELQLVPVSVDSGVGLQATLTKKVPWISAKEMKTSEFAQTMDALESCANNTQFLLTRL